MKLSTDASHNSGGRIYRRGVSLQCQNDFFLDPVTYGCGIDINDGKVCIVLYADAFVILENLWWKRIKNTLD